MSDQNFWGISIYDSQNALSEWGHSFIGTKFLGDNAVIAWAPGTFDPAPRCGTTPCDSRNRSPVYVSAVENGTRVPDRRQPRRSVRRGRYQLRRRSRPARAPQQHVSPQRPTGAAHLRPDRLRQRRHGRRRQPQDQRGLRPGLRAGDPGATSASTWDYAVYPPDPAFLDLALALERTSAAASVPATGGNVAHTLVLRTALFGPMTALQMSETLSRRRHLCRGIDAHRLSPTSRPALPIRR